jgi:hypothetical protein
VHCNARHQARPPGAPRGSSRRHAEDPGGGLRHVRVTPHQRLHPGTVSPPARAQRGGAAGRTCRAALRAFDDSARTTRASSARGISKLTRKRGRHGVMPARSAPAAERRALRRRWSRVPLLVTRPRIPVVVRRGVVLPGRARSCRRWQRSRDRADAGRARLAGAGADRPSSARRELRRRDAGARGLSELLPVHETTNVARRRGRTGVPVPVPGSRIPVMARGGVVLPRDGSGALRSSRGRRPVPRPRIRRSRRRRSRGSRRRGRSRRSDRVVHARGLRWRGRRRRTLAARALATAHECQEDQEQRCTSDGVHSATMPQGAELERPPRSSWVRGDPAVPVPCEYTMAPQLRPSAGWGGGSKGHEG